MTEVLVKEHLDKNLSYTFSISIYNSLLTTVLKKHIINSYFYSKDMYHEKPIYVLLHMGALDILEQIENQKKIIGYIEHIVLDNNIVLILKREEYLDDEAYNNISYSEYSKLTDNEIYKKYISQQNGKALQKAIVENNKKLKELLSEMLNSNVNHSWKKFDLEEETLTVEKIKDMNTDLKIKKNWLQSKIKNASIVSKLAYEDVLENSVEIISSSKSPEIIEDNFDLLFKKLQDKVKEKCGKANYQVVYTGGNQYPLMCNLMDFKSKLNKVIRKYKLDDISKIEKILINHVSNLRPGMQLLKYFIEKDNMSTLAGIYENFEEEKEIITKIETKKVF